MQDKLRLTDNGFVDITVESKASGGFGVVYMGPNRLQGKQWFALKTIKPDKLQTGNTRSRFVRESLNWMHIWPHPNLLTAERLTNIHGDLYLVLEYAQNGSLRDILQNSTPAFGWRYAWAQMIAAGLSAIHSPDARYLKKVAIIHRDLKPSNILIMAGGRAAITDFGLSKVCRQDNISQSYSRIKEVSGSYSDFTDDGRFYGSREYMAPEQWRNTKTVDLSVDIYAFGQILSELLTGRLAIEADHNVGWEEAHLRKRPHFHKENLSNTPTIPPLLEKLCLACLSKNPKDRPSAQEVFAKLQLAAPLMGLTAYEVPEIYPPIRILKVVMLNSLAITYDRLGKYDDASWYIKMSLEIDPNYPDTLLEYGDILTCQKQYDEAIAVYNKAKTHLSANHPSMAIYWMSCGIAYMRSNRLDEAERYFLEVININEHDDGAWAAVSAVHALSALKKLDGNITEEAKEELKVAANHAKRAIQDNDCNKTHYDLLSQIEEIIENCN